MNFSFAGFLRSSSGTFFLKLMIFLWDDHLVRIVDVSYWLFFRQTNRYIADISSFVGSLFLVNKGVN